MSQIIILKEQQNLNRNSEVGIGRECALVECMFDWHYSAVRAEDKNKGF